MNLCLVGHLGIKGSLATTNRPRNHNAEAHSSLARPPLKSIPDMDPCLIDLISWFFFSVILIAEIGKIKSNLNSSRFGIETSPWIVSVGGCFSDLIILVASLKSSGVSHLFKISPILLRFKNSGSYKINSPNKSKILSRADL